MIKFQFRIGNIGPAKAGPASTPMLHIIMNKDNMRVRQRKRRLEQERQVQRRLNRVGERERRNIYFFHLLQLNY